MSFLLPCTDAGVIACKDGEFVEDDLDSQADLIEMVSRDALVNGKVDDMFHDERCRGRSTSGFVDAD